MQSLLNVEEKKMVKLTEKIEQTTLTKTSLKEEKIGYEEKSKVVDDVING